MRPHNLILLLLAGTGLLTGLLIGCGDVENNSSSKTVASIKISPTSASLEAGSSQGFSAQAVYTDSTTAIISPTWIVSGEIGTITVAGYTGLFHATAVGSGFVTAVYSGQSATATIMVTPEVGGGVGLTTVEVSPASFYSRVGGSQTFTAMGLGPSGESIAVSPIWKITGEAVGRSLPWSRPPRGARSSAAPLLR
jgi:hypothetical protein